MDLERLIGKKVQRELKIESRTIDQDARTVELAFSSETPIPRGYGFEVLDHRPEAVRLGRLESGAAVLVDHDRRDVVGVVESVELGSDRKGRVIVRFGRGARATEVFNDVVDGIRRNVSVGYFVHGAEADGELDGETVVRVTDWEPFEVSIVSIPADTTVGVGRSAEGTESPDDSIKDTKPEAAEERTLSENASNGDSVNDESEPSIKSVTMEDNEKDPVKIERERVRDLLDLGKKFDMRDLAQEHIASGKSVDDFRAAALDKMAERSNEFKPAGDPEIGMSRAEIKQFSYVRAYNALANPNDKAAQEAAKFEREVSDAAAVKYRANPQGFMVPYDVLAAERAPMAAGTPTNAGNLIATELRPDAFIELLRKKLILDQIGARTLTGLVGNLAIPKQTGGATGYWVATETTDTQETGITTGQVPLSPKTVGAFTEWTRQMLIQSSMDVENLLRADLAYAMAAKISEAAFYGDGTGGAPTGINGQAPNTLDFAVANAPTFGEFVDMETAIAADDVDGELTYIINQTMRGYAKQTEAFSGTGKTIWQNKMINGSPVAVSGQVADGDVFLGLWSDLIVGMWGGLDLIVDPYSKSKSGVVRLVAMQSVDVAVRHPESFCIGRDFGP